MVKRFAWLEVSLATLIVWLGLVALAFSEGGIGLSWDGINHHIYLGWTAGGHRLDQDFLAANFQTLQFPYLYWPAYQLASHGAGPLLAAGALSALHVLAVPALWLIARCLLPGTSCLAMALRMMSVLLGYLSPVVLSLTDNTANDLMAATPLVWAVALAMQGLDVPEAGKARWKWVLGSGALAGMSIAFKFSNGPLAILLPVFWVAGGSPRAARALWFAGAASAMIAGFAATYGYWGWLLWVRYGNPLYPFYDAWFEPLRRIAGWAA